MKKFSILALAAIAMIGASCKRSIDKADETIATPRTLSITIQSAAASRAVEADGDESKINNGWIFVFRGDTDVATLDCAPVKLKTDGATNSFTVTSKAQTVFVVANAEELDMAAIRNISDLRLQTADLFRAEELTQNKAHLTMWGQNVVDKSNEEKYTANVTMRFAPAKVNFSYTIESDQIALLENPELVVLNAQGYSRLFPNYETFQPSKAEGDASLMPAVAKYYSAISEYGVGEVKSALKVSEVAAQITSTFYLFENISETSTIIAVRGMYGNQMTYFPIHFSVEDKGNVAFEPIVAGKIYNINAKIKHLSGGVTDPSEPVSQTTLEVTIVPAAWYTSISWIKEFN